MYEIYEENSGPDSFIFVHCKSLTKEWVENFFQMCIFLYLGIENSNLVNKCWYCIL